MKRPLIFLLLTLLLLSACSGGNHATITTESTTATTEEPQFIGPITNYTIIIPEKEVDNTSYNSAALDFRRALYRLTGTRLDFRTDRIRDNEIDREVPYEILIGDTNRAESTGASEGLNNGDYCIRTVGTKIVIGFADNASLSSALNKLSELFVREDSLMVPENFEYLHRFEGKTVACVGDSITEGVGASSSKNTYPAQLQLLLGDEYFVNNFGISGASAIGNGRLAYKNTAPYRKVLTANPDIIILMLGMNDANPTHAWNGSAAAPGAISEMRLTEYKNELLSLIGKFEKLESQPTIYLAVITPMTREVGQWSQDYVTHFTNNLNKLREIQREVAAELGLTLIETEAVLNDPTHFADGCHLSNKGYEVLAAHFATHITK